MNLVKDQWKDFNKAWSEKIDKSHLYYKFNEFILCTLPVFEENGSEIKEIVIKNNKIDSTIIKNNKLTIYQSPFYMKINENKYPVALLVENIILSIIKYIENNSSSTIKMTKSYNNNEEEEEEENEE